MIVIRSTRLQLIQFQMTDAQEVFGCITPAIAKIHVLGAAIVERVPGAV
ncbi:MAG TPA: hypothetical protein VJQ59_09355 [Candidatus Sulfotelmatobacter sp.]|nr:hypothetical protein [Candidatus Sulfotelmatobacter sp.]